MYTFFVEPSAVRDGIAEISGSDVNHISNVLRMKVGEKIRVCDQQGQEYICVLESFEKQAVRAAVISCAEVSAELPSDIILFQGLPKGDKMELIIQKAVELGVSRIVPVITRRTIVKLDQKKEAHKRKRWCTVAESAAKQSGRTKVPDVHRSVKWNEALEMADELDHRLIPYELANGMQVTRQCIDKIEKGQSIGVFIGPEGRFEEEEIAQAKEHGIVPITLGKRILRTETAGLTILSVLMYHLESRG